MSSMMDAALGGRIRASKAMTIKAVIRLIVSVMIRISSRAAGAYLFSSTFPVTGLRLGFSRTIFGLGSMLI